MVSVSVVIPAYNEEEGIVQVIQRLQHVARATKGDMEIIVVDDGSLDATAMRAKECGVAVVRHPRNGGYGMAVKSGIREASYDLIAITDADGTYPVERLPEMIERMKEGFDMVVGARQGKEYRGTFLKMPARFLFKFLVEFSTGQRIPDINSGLRVFRKRDVVPLFPHLCDTFSFTATLTLAYCFLHRFVCYVPISYGKRVGRAKVRMVRDSLRTLQYIVESIATFNPLKLFLLMSSFLMLLAALLGAYAWWESVAWVTILVSILFVGSIVLFGMGLQGYRRNMRISLPLRHVRVERPSRILSFIRRQCESAGPEKEVSHPEI
jgi:glycosyltransferase involved in cell wall biosynthesis